MRYVVIVLVCVIFGCNAYNQFESVLKANNEFTIDAFQEVGKTFNRNNFMFSGVSAEIILSLLANGARGETQYQLLENLRLPTDIEGVNTAYTNITPRLNIDQTLVKLFSANKIYLAQNFLISKEFNDTAVNIYDAEVQNLDFENAHEAANTINSWVEQKTNNKIKDLIDSETLTSDTKLVLVNALYFTGQWKNPFPVDNTADILFHSSPTESQKIPTMQNEGIIKYAYNEKLKAKFLELEFADGNISMTFVLPDAINGLADVEQNMAKYLAPQKMNPSAVIVTLPKFRIETTINFTSILESLGITDIFDDADLTGIADARIQVSQVNQKTFIDVNEYGAEAAAATAVSIDSRNAGPQKKFQADHPFLFYIKDNDLGQIIFAGRFTNKEIH
ncbi:ovalbumin-related protein X-like [Diabrotica virgifera virgifera]|uniref:Serpin domain-containing protein n=1 Tax=Diabrotica virgifera virgifera TaxID=50390 RepID=A0ABM5JLT4_DIAVI|nr:ovalbumin-related protein X-like [Diabrotica virgifera virgifera]